MDDVQLKKNLFIPDALLAAQKTYAAWGFGNQLFAFASSEKPAGSLAAHEKTNIHEIKWDLDLHDDITRKLVNESLGIFYRLQSFKKEDSSRNKAIQLVKISREYRAVIKACVLDLQLALVRCHSDEEKQKLNSQLQLFEVTELVWNLCEIMFVDTAPGGVVLNQLQDWLRLHFTEVDRMMRECLQQVNPSSQSEFWDATYLLIYQGRVQEALEMLDLTPDASSPEGQVIVQMLRQMPVFGLLKGQPMADFELRWRHWHDECLHRLQDGTFSQHQHFHIICQILCGEDEVFLMHRDLLETWYVMLISRLFYQHPSVKSFDLQYHVKFCIDAYGGDSQLIPLDHMILSAMEFDIHQLITLASKQLSNWWFAAHLTDLLHHSGQLESQNFSFGQPLREFLVIEYASSLVTHQSLWQVAVMYLDHCPEFGSFYQEQLLDHIPLETNRKAYKVLKMCEDRNFVHLVLSICKRLGMQDVKKGHLGSALSWALRSKDVNFATLVAERYLMDYADYGVFKNLDLIDHLGASMLLSGRLAVLGKYREFHKLYMAQDFTKAASLLLSLLTAKVTPKEFRMTLLVDAIPLLESGDPIFDIDQTHELMSTVQEMLMEHEEEQKEPNKQQAQVFRIKKEKLNILQQCLSKNLARALIHKGSGPSSTFMFETV